MVYKASQAFRYIGYFALLFLTLLSAETLTQSAHAQDAEEQLTEELRKNLVCLPNRHIQVRENVPVVLDKDLCLAAVYMETGVKPLWVTTEGPGEHAEIIRSFLLKSIDHGLDPSSYKVDEITRLWQAKNSEELAKLDTLLTYNLVKYVHDISYGRLETNRANPKLFAEAGHSDFNPRSIINQILSQHDLSHYLNQLPPRHDHYMRLKNALNYYTAIYEQGGWPQLGDGDSIRPGETNSRLLTARQRLFVSGDLSEQYAQTKNPAFFDAGLEEAVRSFQQRHGLEVDGIIGRKTRAAMNISVEEKISTIRINMARWRWQAHQLGSTYIMVNIASFNLKAFTNQATLPALDIPVIVGKKKRQTPVFSDQIKYMDVNPFWNVPPKIAKEEKLKKLRENPYYLVEKNIRLFSNWQNSGVEIDSTTINWSEVSKNEIARYRLRQDPGPGNALGKIKFMFPNKYSVYLHDTPTHSLFRNTTRSFSHGCIRVSDPYGLATFLLNTQEKEYEENWFDQIYGDTERKIIRFASPIPVHITYQTCWVDKSGQIHFNSDIYSRDKLLVDALHL